MYEVMGYDKDNDVFIVFLNTINLKEAIAEAQQLAEKCKRDELLNPDNGEPIDWVEIYDDEANCIWASYEQ